MRPAYYKVLGPDLTPCHGGSGAYVLNEWMPEVAVDPCRSGYHVCRPQDLVHWLGPRIHPAEVDSEVVIHDDEKAVSNTVRIGLAYATWNDRTARLFAADCAEHVVHLCENDPRPQQAIYAARLFAAGKINAAAWAARAAAWDAGPAWAARAAAWDAAWAARTAAITAAGDAWDAAIAAGDAWDAARAAGDAWDAARADWDAARDAERQWQTDRLLDILHDAAPIEAEWAAKLEEAERLYIPPNGAAQ